jgi:hypothetical protein
MTLPKLDVKEVAGLVKENLPAVITSGVLVVLLVSMLVMGAVDSVSVSTARKRVAEAQARLELLEAQASDAESTLARDVCGVDATRATSDVKVIEDVLGKELFGWTSGDSYRSARETFLKKYGVAADSTFARSFLPDGFERVIDSSHVRVAVRDVRPAVVGVSGSSYSYRVEFDVVVTAGDTKQEETYVLVCDVSANGKVSGLWGCAVKDNSR